MATMTVYVCPVCGRIALSSVMVWCPCNPRAPYRMTTKLSLALAARAAKTIRRIPRSR